MEILNRNQRKSALWRIAGLLGLLFTVVTVVLISMNRASGLQERAEIEGPMYTIDSLNVVLAGLKLKYRNDTLRLQNQIKGLDNGKDAKQIESLLEDLQKCEENLEKKQDKIEDLNLENASLRVQLQN